MKIQILGTGCPRCKSLGAVIEETARDLGLSFTMEKVTDMKEIVGFGVMSTPAVAIDGKVVMQGKIPSKDEATALLSSASGT